ncbi:hypothetical protein ACLI09_16955 [Flavobacterium sp. RHBU_24]|uniref:hypothetical protein n=1 Tax=Flavobacterium sp. RHBU_24 TaxID=3391185 RepID=UPI0039855458
MNNTNHTLQPYEYEAAGNAYLMSLAAAVAGLPLPIINVIAAFIYFLARRKSSYAIRWHSLQALLAQLIVMPFNSIALGWTLSIILHQHPFSAWVLPHSDHIVTHSDFTQFSFPPLFWAYLAFVLLLNIFEFIAVISTAIQVRKGINVRWFGIAVITDALCSKENRDPYTI